jgi:hypothetical protein
MRYSRMLGRSLRDAPAGSDTASAGLLARAGYVRQLGAGVYSYLPLAWRSIRGSEIIREMGASTVTVSCRSSSRPTSERNGALGESATVGAAATAPGVTWCWR